MARNRRIQRILVALATAGSLLGLGSAQAAVYTAVWDPPYGYPFLNMEWEGQATFFVPNECLVNNGPVTDCVGATVTTASVDLKTAIVPSFASVPTTSHLTFTPSTLIINKLVFENGKLVGLASSTSNYVEDLLDIAGPHVDFALEFVLGYAGDVEGLTGATQGFSDAVGYNGPLLRHFIPDGEGGTFGTNSLDFQPTFTITQVPEPGSLALAALGLAGLGWRGAQRRRQQRQG